jgi:tetratricopeptide (TPR) repeat protein
VAAFRTAADEDSSFALAHYQLSNAMLWSARGSWASIVDESRAAVRQDGRLGTRARLLVEGHAAFRAGRLDEAEGVFRRVVESFPDDVEGTYQYADLLYHGNGARGRAFTESRAAFERVLATEPAHLGALVHLVRVAIDEGRRAEADSLIDRAMRVAPPPMRLELTALRAFAFGDPAARDHAVELLRTAPDEVVRVAAMRIALHARDTRGAARVARLLLAPSRAPEFRVVGRLQLADLALAEGRRGEALAHLDSARALAPTIALEYKALHLVQPFVSAARDELTAIRDTLRRWTPAETPSGFPMFAVYNGLHAPLRLYLIGMLGVRLGDVADAERQAAALEGDRSIGERGTFARGMGWSLRGHIQSERGRLNEALAAFDRGRLEVSEGLLDAPVGDQGAERFARAEVLRALGRTEEARGWYASLGHTSLDLVIYSGPVAERLAAIDRTRRRSALEPAR